MQDMCKQNALNRSKQTIPHTVGIKTFARKKDEMVVYHVYFNKFCSYIFIHIKHFLFGMIGKGWWAFSW